MNDQTQLIDENERPAKDEQLVEPLIGDRYRISRILGEGGFGTVFEAEQLHPVRRKVAVKVIKLGMDTREVISRFGAERQALALMDHPNIAHVLDAGATASGRPYFVMELVEGEPLSVYCDRHRLTIAERLRVFEQVCQAIQHAHTKGIIHRDLKPSNVLASTLEGRPFVKVIDFGIAKATSGTLGGTGKYTSQHEMIGTPAYMSPEQAEGRTDIDTRADIYALGVLLYQLIAGSTPFATDTLQSVSVSEVQRIIRDIEPSRPSAQLAKSGEDAEIAHARQCEPAKLRRILRGELDWIVMKALDKDRGRRYQSASALVDDVERYLSNQAVLAAPPSLSYRMGRFVRRNRALVTAAVLVALSLLVGIVGFAWQAQIAREQARIAELRTEELAQVAKFQAEMLGQVDPREAGQLLSADVQARFASNLQAQSVPGAEHDRAVRRFAEDWQRVNATDAARQLIVSSVLEPAVVAIDSEFADQPVVAAALLEVVAQRYRDMGLSEQGLPLQQRCLSLRRVVLGDDHLDTLRAVSQVGQLLRDLGRLVEAQDFYLESLDGHARVLGESHVQALDSIHNMGALLRSQRKLEEAEGYYRRAIAGYRRTLGENAPRTLISSNNLGLLLRNQGRLADAEAIYQEILAKRRKIDGLEHVDTLSTLYNLGMLYQAQGQMAVAQAHFEEALAGAKRALGEEHYLTLYITIGLGAVLAEVGREADAVAMLESAEETVRETFGGSNAFRIARWLTAMAEAHVGLQQLADAKLYLDEAARILEHTPGPGSSDLDYYREVLEQWQSAAVAQ